MGKKIDIFDFVNEHKNKNVGETVRKYKFIYSIILIVISLLEIAMIIRGIAIFNFSKTRHVLYFISYFLLFTSSAAALLLVNGSKTKDDDRVLSITIHSYVTVLYIWSFLVSFLDLQNGHSPIVYLTIVIAVGGITLLNFYYYLAITSFTFISLTAICYIFNFQYIKTNGDIINLVVLIIMAILMNYRLYRVTNTEADERHMLDDMLHTDILTGLGNEYAYIEYTESLNKTISEEENVKFAVMVMDLNGLKATNDKYGHRYGCNLVVEAGHRLPNVFRTSKLFHIGGDEFVGIIVGNDYDDFDKKLKLFDETMTRTTIQYEGQETLLSLARGYSMFESGDSYKNVFQRADNMMYENKKILKEELNIASR